MEYFLGSLISFTMTYALYRVLQKHKKNKQSFRTEYTQSTIFEIVRPFILNQIQIMPMMMTQAMKDIEKNTLRVLYLEEKAYWIENNQLFEAEAPLGDVHKDSAIKVDTMGMDDVQLKRTMFIVEKLREGLQNDSGYPGDTKI